MAITGPGRRRDPYGRPLPVLVTSHESTYERAANEEQRQRIAAILNIYYETLLHRDVTADLSISFRVVDGVIQDDMRLGLNRLYRTYRGDG